MVISCNQRADRFISAFGVKHQAASTTCGACLTVGHGLLDSAGGVPSQLSVLTFVLRMYVQIENRFCSSTSFG